MPKKMIIDKYFFMFPSGLLHKGKVMSQPAVAPGEYSLAYDPQRFNMKAIFSYEVNNHIYVRKNKLMKQHNDLTEDERHELSTLLTVEKYLQERLEELKPVTV